MNIFNLCTSITLSQEHYANGTEVGGPTNEKIGAAKGRILEANILSE